MSFSAKSIKKKIEQVIDKTMDKLVDSISHNLASRSPVWTGQYVQSHIVETESKEYPRSERKTPPPYPPKHSDPAGLKMAMEERLKKGGKIIARKHKKVAFNNEAEHAVLVEYNYPPGMIYGVAEEVAILNKTKFVKEAKREVFKT